MALLSLMLRTLLRPAFKPRGTHRLPNFSTITQTVLEIYKMKVAVICMTTTPDQAANYRNAEKLVRESAANGARWVVLPEMFTYMGQDRPLREVAQEDAKRRPSLQALAAELKVTLFAGSMCEESESGDGLVYNSAFVFGPDGAQVAKYRKIHLFNLYGADGKRIICESDRFKAGTELCTFAHEGLRVGLAICYDLRFGELFTALAKEAPLDVIVLPSAFTAQTGALHWELLLRARAVEQQCYVLGSNQHGHHYGERRSYGHSMIVDPIGAITGQSVDGIAYATLDSNQIAKARGMIPVRSDRRLL